MLSRIFGKTGFQDVLLLHLRGIAVAEVAEAGEVRRGDLWAEGNHLQGVFEVEVGNGPLLQCLETFEAERVVGDGHWCITHGFNQNPRPCSGLTGPLIDH